MIEQNIQIQKILIEYFKDFNDDTIIKVIKSFVYEESTNDNEIGEIIEKFLYDNSLKTAYVNVILDKSAQYFTRSTGSQREIIDSVKVAFLNLAFNRFKLSAIELKLAKSELDIAKSENNITINKLKIKKSARKNKVNPSVGTGWFTKAKKVKFRFDDDTDADVHVNTTLNNNYTLCGISIDGDYTHDVELNSTEKITCQHCLDIINQCKTTKI